MMKIGRREVAEKTKREGEIRREGGEDGRREGNKEGEEMGR